MSLSAQFARVAQLAASARIRQAGGEVDNSQRPLERHSRQGRGRALGELLAREREAENAIAHRQVLTSLPIFYYS